MIGDRDDHDGLNGRRSGLPSLPAAAGHDPPPE